jgi:hypothetical protein
VDALSRLITAFGLLIFAAGCGRNLPFDVAHRTLAGLYGQPLTGTGIDETGQQRRLEDFNDRPMVLMLSEEFCSTCNEEAEMILRSLQNPALAPDRVRLITIMVGAIPDDVIHWRKKFNKPDFPHDIPWQIWADESSEFMKRYADDLQTPWMLISRPGEGIVFRAKGKVSLDTIKAYTGEFYSPLFETPNF